VFLLQSHSKCLHVRKKGIQSSELEKNRDRDVKPGE
jgi:hypothetical protein